MASCAGERRSAPCLASRKTPSPRGKLWSALLVALLAWAGTWAAGEASARVLFGPRYATVGAAFRLPLGLCTLIVLLEAAGYFAPLRVGGFVVLAPIGFGAFLLSRRL